jgi:hypothetical protein
MRSSRFKLKYCRSIFNGYCTGSYSLNFKTFWPDSPQPTLHLMLTTVEACGTYLLVRVLWEIVLVPLEQVIYALKDLVVGGVPQSCEDVLECAGGELWRTGTVLNGVHSVQNTMWYYNIAYRYIIHNVLFLSLRMRYFRASGICLLLQACWSTLRVEL